MADNLLVSPDSRASIIKELNLKFIKSGLIKGGVFVSDNYINTAMRFYQSFALYNMVFPGCSAQNWGGVVSLVWYTTLH